MSGKRTSKASSGGKSQPSESQTSKSSPYLVPGIVLGAVIVALVAMWFNRTPAEVEPPTPEEPTAAEAVFDTNPELVAMRQEATVILQRVVDRWTRDAAQPWLLMHGTLVWGPRHLTTDAKPAGQHLLDNVLTTEQQHGREVMVFPIDEPGGARVDAHVDQTVKTLVETGFHDPRIDRIVEDAKWRFEYSPGDELNPFKDGNETPWSAQAFCQTASEGDNSFVTYEGHTVDMRVMTEQLVGQLERESRFLDDIRQAGDTTYDKRRQGIFRYTCGGTHLFMGADACVAAGFGSPELSARLAYQMDLLFWRMMREIEAVNAALTEAPNMAPLLVEQRVKYLGHFLEAEAKAELNGTFVPTAEHRQQLVFAEQALYLSVKQLKDMGVFDRLDSFKDNQYEYYLFTAGDACHALHAMNLQDKLAAQRKGGEYRTPQPVYPSDEEPEADGETAPQPPVGS